MMNPVIADDLRFIAGQELPWQTLHGKTVLVSGAAGFMPSYLVDTLLHLRAEHAIDVKVIGLVRNLESARQRFADSDPAAGLTLLVQDVCDAVEIDGPVDWIIHAASIATPKRFRKDPVGTILPNVLGTRQLLQLATDKQSEGFLFFSTSGVYGHLSADCYPLPEDRFGALDPMDLASCYLESKRQGENLCVAWQHQYGLPVKVVRPAINYGPGIALDDGRSFADFIACIVQRRDIELYSDGKVIRNFCYLADAIHGIFRVLLLGKPGEAYNVATDHEISVLGLAEYLVDEVFPERGLKVVMRDNPNRDYLRVDFARTTVDISKVRALGWTLHFPIREGFRRVVDSFEQGRQS